MEKIHLPKTIGIWTRPDLPEIINSKNIFDYMDGAGELYISYRFDHLEVYSYEAEDQNDILVELYFMESSDDAFGLLSLDWGGKPVSFNPSENMAKHFPVPPSRALYGEGLLRLWSDNLYARVMAQRETPESREAVLKLGRIITKNRKNPTAPKLFKVLPLSVENWTLCNDRTSYFRSYLVLNSIYYLSQQNILNLDLSTEAVTAPYEYHAEIEGRKRLRFLFVKYATLEHARKALNRFYKAYLPEQEKDLSAGISSEKSNFYKVEDGWLGYKLKGRCIALVFESPDKDSAQRIINQTKFNLKGV